MEMRKKNTILKRYTNFSSMLHILETEKITLLDPRGWVDRNDSFFIEEFRKKAKYGSVLALCFSSAPETYHHWHVFSSGSDGVCIYFNKDKLTNIVNEEKNLEIRKVEYRQIKELKGIEIADKDLPFFKRYPYRDEQEVRIIAKLRRRNIITHSFDIQADTIEKIVLSPWLKKDLKDIVKSTIKKTTIGGKLPISHSSLIENELWKSRASGSRGKIVIK